MVVKSFLQKVLSWLMPQYHELVTYQSTLVCILLLVTYPELHSVYVDILHEEVLGGWIFLISIIAILGMIFSIWHVFISRKKEMWENQWMGAFVLGVNGLAGVAAGIEFIPGQWSWLVLFPLWNILYGAILLYQLGFAENVITDENASLLEVGIATLSLLAVFAIAKYGFRFTWPIIFSVCMVYSSIITSVVSWFGLYFSRKSQ